MINALLDMKQTLYKKFCHNLENFAKLNKIFNLDGVIYIG